jgi:DNA polymerase-3 subunit alpha
MSFVHLHNHTHYSILSALAKPNQYVQLAKAQGSPAVAITDSGVMYGAMIFINMRRPPGLNRSLIEAYIAPLGHTDKTPENRYYT